MGCLLSKIFVPLNPVNSLIEPTSQELSRVQLHTPIYVAIRSYSSSHRDYLSFEQGDEMEFIENIHLAILRVNHLRSGCSGLVSMNQVQLAVDTPLRLAVDDRAIINRCLMHDNTIGAYLIRRSRTTPNHFVLSINQVNPQRNTIHWHYLIGRKVTVNYFYFVDEPQLADFEFASFSQLVSDEHFRRKIPVTQVLPYVIEFGQEIWSIPFDQIAIEQRIGEGEFGEVFRAQWRYDQTVRQVAVKKIRMHGITELVTREIETMKVLTNLHIVSFYGVSKSEVFNEICLITEYMENGNLKSWLQQLDELPDQLTILRFARQISYGMSYLEMKNFIHRDLACRNILVGSEASTVKIADFGLSCFVNDRDAQRRHDVQLERLATRWAAPEVLANPSNFSIKADVWSYGIVLIEIWLKGENPYESAHPTYIAATVMDGLVHRRPDDCPEDFYRSIICRCLEFQVDNRPSFEALANQLNHWEFS